MKMNLLDPQRDESAVLWGIGCCLVAILTNIALLYAGISISLVVPWTFFGVPLTVTVLIKVCRRMLKQ